MGVAHAEGHPLCATFEERAPELHHLLEDRQEVLHDRDAPVREQDERPLEDALHAGASVTKYAPSRAAPGSGRR
jgi:hypothetical protein